MNSFQDSVNAKMPADRMPGRGDREDDLDHGPDAAGAVDAGALLQLLRDRLEVAHHEPGAERDQERRVGQDQGPGRVPEPEVPDDVRQRDEQERRRHEVRHEDPGAQRAGQRKAEPGERVAGEDPAEDRDQRRDDRDEHRVVEPRAEHGLPEEIGHVLPGRARGPERLVVDGAPRPVELGVRPEGGDQHPVEGEERPDEERGQGDVEEHPLLPPGPLDHPRARTGPPGHQAPSTRRMYQSWITTTMKSSGNIARDAAAPSPRRPVLIPIW